MILDKVLVICGATATGKTALAVDCAIKLKGEIVSADSQLVYKGLNIGTAKPTTEEMRGVVHHMIDVSEPQGNFSVGDYRDIAVPILNGLLSEGKVPVICGGTGFYINSLLFRMNYGGIGCDLSVRKKLEDFLVGHGSAALYKKLIEIDPKSAEKLHENDVKRVMRALEIFELTGRRKSEQNDGFDRLHDYVAVAVNYPREELYDRINARVDEMFEKGLVDEVRRLVASGVNGDCQCMQAIGYKEVLECLDNGNNESTMRDIIKQNTRRYAKRQITFFKKLPEIIWLEPQKATAEAVCDIFYEKQRIY